MTTNNLRCNLCDNAKAIWVGDTQEPCPACASEVRDGAIDDRERESAYKKEDGMSENRGYSQNAQDFQERVLGTLEVCHPLDDVTYRAPEGHYYFHREAFHRPFHLALQENGLDWMTSIGQALDNKVAVRYFRFKDKAIFVLNPDRTVTKVTRHLSDDKFVLVEKTEEIVGKWSMRKPFKNGSAGGVKSENFSKILTIEVEGEEKVVAPVYECHLGGVKFAMKEVARRIQKRMRLSTDFIQEKGLRKPYSNKHEGLLMNRESLKTGLGTTKFKASN